MKRKIISIIMVICLALQVLVTVNAEGSLSLSSKQNLLLSAFGINTAVENGMITKGEFAQMLASVLKLGEKNDYEASIEYLKGRGLIGDDWFSGSNLKTEEAYYIVLKTVGYPVENEYSKIMSFAGYTGISEDISGESYITRIDSLKLIYNMLYTETLKYVSDTEFSPSGKSFMADRLSVYEVKGTVTDDGVNSFDGESVLEEGKIKIDDLEFQDKTGMTIAFGYKIFGYAYKSDEENILLAADFESYNEELIITDDKLIKFSDMTYTYENESGREKKVKIDSGAVIVYNGITVKTTDDFNEEMLNPKSGEHMGIVRLLDRGKDGNYDVVFIESYETYIADGVSVENKSIIYKYAQGMLELEDKEYLILDENSAKLTLNDITAGDVLHIGKSVKGEYYLIRVIKNTISANVISVSDEEIKLDNGETYMFAEGFSASKSGLNIYCKLYFDMFGRVVDITAISGEGVYSVGYLYKAKQYMDDEGEERVMITLFTKEAGVIKLNLAEKVKFFAANKTDAVKIDDDALILELENNKQVNVSIDNSDLPVNSIYEGIVRYSLDKNGDVNYFEIPLNAGIACKDENRFRQLLNNSGDNSDVYYGYQYMMMGYPWYTLSGMANLSGTTNFLYNTSEEDIYKRMKITDTPAADNRHYIVAYGTSAVSKTAEYTVKYIDYEKASVNQYAMVVESVDRTLDEDDNVVITVTGLRLSSKVTYKISEDVATNLTSVLGSETNAELSRGDIIWYRLIGDEIVDLGLAYDADLETEYSSKEGFIPGVVSGKYDAVSGKGNPSLGNYSSEKWSPVVRSEYTPLGGRFGLVGYVYSFDQKTLSITTQDLSSRGYNSELGFDDGYIDLSFLMSGTMSNIMCVTNGRKETKVSRAALTDIKPYTAYGTDCSKVFYTQNGGAVSIFIINE